MMAHPVALVPGMTKPQVAAPGGFSTKLSVPWAVEVPAAITHSGEWVGSYAAASGDLPTDESFLLLAL